MPAEFSDTMSNLFRQANETFQNAMQTGLKMQQEMLSAWTKPFTAETENFQERGRKMIDASVKMVQKNFEESQRLADTQYRQSLDLLKKAFDAAKPGDKNDLFENTKTLWQQTMDTMRHNAEQLAKTNTTVIENWSDLVHHSLNGHAKKSGKTGAMAE